MAADRADGRMAIQIRYGESGPRTDASVDPDVRISALCRAAAERQGLPPRKYALRRLEVKGSRLSPGLRVAELGRADETHQLELFRPPSRPPLAIVLLALCGALLALGARSGALSLRDPLVRVARLTGEIRRAIHTQPRAAATSHDGHDARARAAHSEVGVNAAAQDTPPRSGETEAPPQAEANRPSSEQERSWAKWTNGGGLESLAEFVRASRRSNDTEALRRAQAALGDLWERDENNHEALRGLIEVSALLGELSAQEKDLAMQKLNHTSGMRW